MRRPLNETQHLPIGFSDEAYRSSIRWILLALMILLVAGVGVTAAVLMR